MNFNLSENLAEICGIHAGDGYLRNDGRRVELDISSNIEEKEFYDKHVIPLFSKFFKIKINGKYFPSRNTYGFVIRDKNIIVFFHNIGFPYGRKTTIVKVPSMVLNSNTFAYRRFLRGFFDTDGCLTFDKKHKKYHYYPRIILVTCSYNLFSEACRMLRKIGISFHTQIYKPKNKNENNSYRIWIRGKERVEKWMETIGSKNSSRLSRYKIWKKFGFCPPNLTFEERKRILKKDLNPFIFYEPVAQLG